jgi:DNA-binding MarR family transcriptional regulator
MMSGVDELVDPAERITYVIRMLSGALTQGVEQALRPVRLTLVQLGALVYLCRGGDMSTAELARRVGVTPQSMASALSGLEARELIARAPHPTHGRVVQVGVTDAGRALATRAQRLTLGVDARALALLSPDERQHLHALLLALATGLGLPIEHDRLIGAPLSGR